MDVDDSAATAAVGATAGGGGGDSAALMEILMDDDELDAMAELAEAPVAAQISHSQIIEKQAHSIAKLERQVARAKEYKELTKVKLKEAALRLREYRLKVEALMVEVEQLKKVQQASEKMLKQMQKQSGDGSGEQVPDRETEEPAMAGRGKGGRGRGRGRGGGRGRGRGRGAVAVAVSSSEGVGDDEKPAAETNNIGVQAEIIQNVMSSQDMATQCDSTTAKSFSDAATQTEQVVTAEERMVETTETGMQTQVVGTARKCVDNGSQTTISGEIRAVNAAVSVGLQTETPSFAELGCQCDLPSEENSVDRIFNDHSSQQIGDFSTALGSTSAAAAVDVEEAKASVSRKRKRSFESTGRGELPPKPSALLAKQAQLVSKSDDGDREMVHTAQAGADVEAGDSANCTKEDGESDRATAIRTAVVAETNREIVGKKSTVESQPEVPSERTNAGVSTPTDQVTVSQEKAESSKRRVESVNQVESCPLSRIPFSEIKSDALAPATQNHVEPSAANHIDAIGAEIDAELGFSDSGDEDMESDLPGIAESQQQHINKLANALPAHRAVKLDAAVCDMIDKELDFDSSDDEEDMTEDASSKPTVLLGDAVSAAIDDELASSDEEEEVSTASPAKTPTRASTGSFSKDLISAAIDDKLASSSDDDEEETSGLHGSTISVTNAAVAATIDDELASILDDDEEDTSKHPASTALVNDVAVTAAFDDELTSSSDEEPEQKSTAQPAPSTFLVIKDPISAAIDDELATSSDEEGVADGAVQSAAADASVTSDPIGAAIDDELASSSDEDDPEERQIVQPIAKAATVKQDPIGAAIDDELASSSDEEDSADQPIRPEEAPFTWSKDPVAAAIDDELASSSDEEADQPSAKPVSAADSPVHDPIGAAIDDELASSSDDEEPENHTDAPPPPSTSGVDNVIGVAVSMASSLIDVAGSDKYRGETADESKSVSISALAEATVAHPETGSVEVMLSSSSTKKDLAGAAIDDELASSSDEEESEKQATEMRVSDQGASAEVKAAVCDVAKTEDLKSLPNATPARTPESSVSFQDAVATADMIEVPVRSQIKSDFSGARSPKQSPDQSVVGAQTSVETDLNEQSSDFQAGDSSTASGDVVKVSDASTLSLSSSSDSDGSDSSDSSSDSEEDRGMDLDFEPQEVESEVPIEKEALSPSPMKPTGETGVHSVGEHPEQHLANAPAETSAGGSKELEKLQSQPSGSVLDASKNATRAASALLYATTGVASNGQDDSCDQSPRKKRSRAETLITTGTVENGDVQLGPNSSFPKKQKLREDDLLSQNTEIINNSEKKEDDETFSAKVTGKEELSSTGPQPVQPKQVPKDSHTKHLVAFQHDIARKDKENEKTDDLFVFRTLTVLAKYCAKHGARQPILVSKFCKFLAADYRNKNISPMEMVKGACELLRSPKIRHLIENHCLGMCFLAHQVLMGLVGASNQGDDVKPVAETEKYLLAECLAYLRSLLLGDRSAALASTADVFSQLQSTRAHKNAVSHDKEFLAHVCSFYTRVCNSIGFDECISVLLFDMLRRNPNIKGLFYTCFIVEIAPELLQIQYDKRGRAQEVLLRDTILHVLPVVATQSARRQELLLKHSSQNILHQIAKYIHADSLVQVDATGPAFSGAFAAKMWNDYILPLAEGKVATDEKDRIFEVCKSLELLATAYEYRQMMELFPVERFQDAFAASEHSEGGAALIKMVGAIAVVFAEAITSKVSKARNSIAHDGPGSTCADYVLRVCGWLQKLLTQGRSMSESTVEVQAASAALCVELITAAAATREQRDEMLRDVLKWFRSQSHEQQMRFPGSFLRQLRLVTVSTRPVMPVMGG